MMRDVGFDNLMTDYRFSRLRKVLVAWLAVYLPRALF